MIKVRHEFDAMLIKRESVSKDADCTVGAHKGKFFIKQPDRRYRIPFHVIISI